MRKNRISETIGNINQKYVNEATAYTGEVRVAHRPIWMKWGAIAACFILVAAFSIGIFQSGIFGVGDRVATLDNGKTISFVKTDPVAGQLDIAYEISTRDLTAEEITNLFGELPISAHAIFNNENDSILGVEGKYDDMKLVISVPAVILIDTVIDGEEKASTVDGVAVKAGYFSRGNTVIYYATFDLGENTVYIENSGVRDDSEAVKNEIAAAIQNIIALEQIDLLSINK